MVMSPVYQSYLCDDSNFDKPVWMTQARKYFLFGNYCTIPNVIECQQQILSFFFFFFVIIIRY